MRLIDADALIERLEELGAYTCSYCINEAIEIVKDLASEYNNGWISVEECIGCKHKECKHNGKV